MGRDRSPERRSAIRNAALQKQLAGETQGRSYDLTSVNDLVDDLSLEDTIETRPQISRLWCTPLWFGLVVIFMLGEWFSRKMTNLL